MKMTEQYDGFMFCHSWTHRANSKLDWLTHSVVLPTSPEWNLWGPKRNGYPHWCIARPTSWDRNQSKLVLISLKQMNWKEHIFHTNSGSSYKSTLDSEWSVCRRINFNKHTTKRSSGQHAIDRLRGPDDEPRMVQYKHNKHPEHDWICYLKLRGAQNACVVFHQSSSDTFCTTMRRSSLDKAGRRTVVRKETPDFDRAGGTSDNRNGPLRISSQPEVPHTRRRESGKHFPGWQNKSWIIPTNRGWLPNTILCHVMIQRLMLNKWATWNDMTLTDRGLCAMSKMIKIPETRRHTVVLWSCASWYHPRGHETGRATNRQSIHLVRPWHCFVQFTKDRRCSKLKELQKSKEQQDHLHSSKKHKFWTIVDRYLDGQKAQGIHTDRCWTEQLWKGTTINSWRKTLTSYGHFQRGFRGGTILQHRIHGDNHHNLLHLTLKYTCWAVQYLLQKRAQATWWSEANQWE